MADDKFERVKLMKKRLRESFQKAKSHASDVLSITQSYEDLDKYFEWMEADLVKRSRELEAKEKVLKERSQAVESKAQSLEKKAREIASAGGKQKEIDSLKAKVQSKTRKLGTLFHRTEKEERVEALRRNEVPKEVDDSKEKGYKNSEKKQQFEEKTHEETLKMNLRDCTKHAELQEEEVQRANAELRKLLEELETNQPKLDGLLERSTETWKILQDLRARQRQVGLSEKSLGKGRSNEGGSSSMKLFGRGRVNREVRGAEGSNLSEKSLGRGRGQIRGTEGSNSGEKSLVKARGHLVIRGTEGSNLGEKSPGRGRGRGEIRGTEGRGKRHLNENDEISSKKAKM